MVSDSFCSFVKEKISRRSGFIAVSIDILVAFWVNNAFCRSKSNQYLNQLESVHFRIIYTGYKRDLTQDDLWELEKSELSEYLTNKFEANWNKKANAYIKENRANLQDESTEKKKTKATYKSGDNQNEEEVNLKEDVRKRFYLKKLAMTMISVNNN